MPKRTLFDISMRPVSGSLFQSTGFPDLGAATFDRPTTDASGEAVWEKALLVESPQSMANHLEATCWDPATNTPVPEVTELAWVRVVNPDGKFLTSSRLESHRLAGSYVKDAMLDGKEFKHAIKERLDLQDNVPLAPRDIAAAVFGLDPLCLLHGVFFAEKATVWPGQPKIARAVTAVIEAHDVRRAESGGVKRDAVGHSKGEGQEAKGGYGSIPFHRSEWTARKIVLNVSIDESQLASYGLPDKATRLLSTLARWQLRTVLDRGLRLRTACDLVPVGETDGLASMAALTEELKALIAGCSGSIGDRGSPLTVVWDPATRRSKDTAADDPGPD